MAQIRVEKKRTNIWPWVLGLILLAILLWVMLAKRGDLAETEGRRVRGAALELGIPTNMISIEDFGVRAA